jgi:hypothetical protein
MLTELDLGIKMEAIGNCQCIMSEKNQTIASTRVEEVAMEVKVSSASQVKAGPVGNDIDQYREAVRKLINSEVKKTLEEEVQKAALEILEDQKKAIREILDEHKRAIQQVVEEEKKDVWEKAEALMQSIVKMGL